MNLILRRLFKALLPEENSLQSEKNLRGGLPEDAHGFDLFRCLKNLGHAGWESPFLDHEFRA